MSRAFFYAGARALLVSHWAVESNPTVKLITKTLNTMAADKTISRSEALRRSMVSLIESGEPYEAHPAYWAPFIVVGEGSAASAPLATSSKGQRRSSQQSRRAGRRKSRWSQIGARKYGANSCR
jgi:CHAT domain